LDIRKLSIGLFCLFLIMICCSQVKSERYTYSEFLKQLANGSYKIEFKAPKAIANVPYSVPCKEWEVSADYLINSFLTSKVVTGEEYSILYNWYPCEVTGSFYNKHTRVYFKVNMANTAIVTNDSFGELNIVFKNADKSFDD